VTTVRDETSLAISHTLRSMFSFQRTICVAICIAFVFRFLVYRAPS
jgi:hypothetical protein